MDRSSYTLCFKRQDSNDSITSDSHLLGDRSNNQRRMILLETENRNLRAELVASQRLIRQSRAEIERLTNRLRQAEQSSRGRSESPAAVNNKQERSDSGCELGDTLPMPEPASTTGAHRPVRATAINSSRKDPLSSTDLMASLSLDAGIDTLLAKA